MREFHFKAGRAAIFLVLAGAFLPVTHAQMPETKPAVTAANAGPRLTAAELFGALNLDLPQLSEVKNAANRQDWTAAKAALAQYLRQRTVPGWHFDPRKIDRTIGWNQKAAEDAISGKIQVVTLWHTFPNGEIDWSFNLTKADPKLPDNNEWQWQLNRMHFWSALASAYWATGDEKYAQAWVRQLRSWVDNQPRPDKVQNVAGSSWRTIETGIRLGGAWPNAYHRFLTSPSFTPDDIALYLKSSLEQARYLRQFPSTGNWLTMEMSGLYTTGALFPEFKEAKEWRTYAANALFEELKTQFLPDGAQIELTPGYHMVALDNVLQIPSIAKITGHEADLPAGYVAGAERAFDFSLYLMSPDRDLPTFNDSWPVPVKRVMEKASALFPGRADYRWIATDGKEGAPPTRTSHAFDWAGYYAMRSGWNRDDHLLVLDAGTLGYGHVHQDKLNVVLWPYGRRLLFDGGGGSYESSKWRSYGTDTFSHNTVLVDGLPQRRQTRDRAANVAKAPENVNWQSDAQFDFARGVYADGYGKEDNRIATHTRRVLYVKPNLFIVADTLAPRDNAEHTYQARWHLLTTSTTKDETTGAVVTTDNVKPNLAVIPLLTQNLETRVASAQTEPELLGWHVRKDEDPQYVPATTVLHTQKGTGTRQFVTVLLPLKAGEVSPIKNVQQTATGNQIELTDGRRWLIQVSADPAGAITFHETLPDGKTVRTAEAK